jgi:hypothetical protein
MLATMTPVAELPAASICAPTETPRPTATIVVEKSRISCEHVTNESLSRKMVFEGFPQTAVQVLSTSMDSRFKATWSLESGLNMGLAEPGMLANENKFEKINRFPFKIQTGLQGFTFVVFQEGILEWTGIDGKTRKVEAPEKDGRTHGVLIRERYNVNGNKPFEIIVTCGVDGHAQVQHFDAGAFVSESQMGQVSLAVFTAKNLDGTKNDNTANKEFTLTVIDENTGGHTAATQSGMGQPFIGEEGSRNW